MKRAALSRLVWTLGLLSCLAAWGAAEAVDLEAYVPFTFSVGNVVLPAGDYHFYQGPEGQLRVSGDAGQAAEILYTSRARSRTVHVEAALIFKRSRTSAESAIDLADLG